VYGCAYAGGLLAHYRVGQMAWSGLWPGAVSPPGEVAHLESLAFGAGTGWREYPELRARLPMLRIDDAMLPRALEIARLGLAEFHAGRATTAGFAQPVYLRDQVVSTR